MNNPYFGDAILGTRDDLPDTDMIGNLRYQ